MPKYQEDVNGRGLDEDRETDTHDERGRAGVAVGEEQRFVGGEGQAQHPPRRAHGIARRVGKYALLVLAGYYAVCILLMIVYRFVEPPITAVQLQRCFESWFSGRMCREQIKFVPYSRLPAVASRAVIAAEDGNFWRHWGFDFEQMVAAGGEALEGDIRGASTIDQQLMKNLFGCACRNPVRKVNDMVLTLPAELILGKRRILELYLNNVEWGPQVFGIEAAAHHHYGVRARNLSRTQAAGLAALLPNPQRRTPANTPQYRAEILRRMSVRGW